MSQKPNIRKPAVSGMFYDDSPALLRKQIKGFLEKAQVSKPQGIVRGLVSPHAGYVYSGFTAAHAYKLIQGCSYDAVVLIGPSHREYFDGISVFSGDAYETPLGIISVHKEVREELLQKGRTIISSVIGHRAEHSLEVQLPFLQEVLGEFSLIPVVLGDQRYDLCSELIDALVNISAKRNLLFIASSDLSHYHSSKEARLLDRQVLDQIQLFNPKAFFRLLDENAVEACGGGPIGVVMDVAQRLGANKADILHSCNSGDITGDTNTVVGYMAAAFQQVS